VWQWLPPHDAQTCAPGFEDPSPLGEVAGNSRHALLVPLLAHDANFNFRSALENGFADVQQCLPQDEEVTVPAQKRNPSNPADGEPILQALHRIS